MKATFPALTLVLTFCASSAYSQVAIESYSPSQFSVVRDILSANTNSTYKSFVFRELTGDLYTDALMHQGTQLSMIRNVGRYEYIHNFGAASNACTTIATSPTAAVVSCESSGLKRYQWSSTSFAMGAATALNSRYDEPAWTNCTLIDSLQLANTYIAACRNSNEILIGRLSGTQILDGHVLAVGGVVNEMCMFDWDNDGSPEVAVAGTSGIYILNASAQSVYTLLGDLSSVRFARLPQSGGDRLMALVPDPTAGLTYLTLIAPPPTPGAQPVLDPPLWFPMFGASDVVVADYDEDGALDAIVCDGTPGQTQTQAWIAYQTIGTPPPGASRFHGDLTGGNGIIDRYALHSSAPSSATLLAVGDYDNDGDVDLAAALSVQVSGQPVRKLLLMPSATIPSMAEWVVVPAPVMTLTPIAPGLTQTQVQLDYSGIEMPPAPPTLVGVPTNPIQNANALEIAIWFQDPEELGGFVHTAASIVHYVPFTPPMWGQLLPPFSLPTFTIPNLEDGKLQIQYTLVQRNSTPATVQSGPSLTGYYSVPLDFVATDDPTTLPRGLPTGPSIKPPSGSTTP